MNKQYKWLHEFLETLAAQKIFAGQPQLGNLNSWPLININSDNWQKFFSSAAEHKYRFVALFAKDLAKEFVITAVLEHLAEHVFIRTAISAAKPEVDSIATYYPGANRLERHTHDLLGIDFIDHPEQKRWTRHQAWKESEFPLRKDFSARIGEINATVTPPDTNYPFLKVQGTGVYEIPVGPVHAGIIEPGHFRFQAAGEDVINLEERLGYLHKGIEKIAEGRDALSLVRLASRVSGDSTVAYAWSAAIACENAYAIKVPERAIFLRAIMAERERIANHLGDFAAICNDVGFAFAYYQLNRLKELWLRLNAELFHHRFMMDCIVPGGVKFDLDEVGKKAILEQLVNMKKELDILYPIIENNSSLHHRLKDTGILNLDTAINLGTLGYVARASGCKLDLRNDIKYAPYQHLQVRVPVYSNGDVLARTRIRAQEILISLELLNNLLRLLPDGTTGHHWQNKNKAAEGVAFIEGWRGEIFTYVSFDSEGKVERYFPRDPSWFNWLALEKLIHGNIVPDFPVCNKSVNGTYAGVDL
jgi:Ni,Fe-hydrogenase III large subunit/Ni,Fe-hydrogenase III component G